MRGVALTAWESSCSVLAAAIPGLPVHQQQGH